MSTISVLLTDDNQVLCKGFRAILERESDIKVVGEAENGRQAVELTLQLRPNVVLMDIAMPVLNGLLATKEIRVLVPETRVIVISAYGDAEYVEQAIAFGAVGFGAVRIDAAQRSGRRLRGFRSFTVGHRAGAGSNCQSSLRGGADAGTRPGVEREENSGHAG